LEQRIPLRLLGILKDAGNTVAFLASVLASYIPDVIETCMGRHVTPQAVREGRQSGFQTPGRVHTQVVSHCRFCVTKMVTSKNGDRIDD